MQVDRATSLTASRCQRNREIAGQRGHAGAAFRAPENQDLAGRSLLSGVLEAARRRASQASAKSFGSAVPR